MAKREEERRRRQAEDNYLNQMWRGIDMFAPSGAPMTHCIGIYPQVSRRGRIMKEFAERDR
jgi:hypothetical protein